MWNVGKKVDNVIREMKTLYPNFENVTSELWKRYIRTLKTLNPDFENVTSEISNVISELWNVTSDFRKRYIWIRKRYIRTLKTFSEKKSHSAKKPKGGPFGLRLLLEA